MWFSDDDQLALLVLTNYVQIFTCTYFSSYILFSFQKRKKQQQDSGKSAKKYKEFKF